jgi:hypothetical protein
MRRALCAVDFQRFEGRDFDARAGRRRRMMRAGRGRRRGLGLGSK